MLASPERTLSPGGSTTLAPASIPSRPVEVASGDAARAVPKPPRAEPEVRRASLVTRAEAVVESDPRREIAVWQIQLERRHFASGTIDGDWGMRSRRALRQFQLAEGLPASGELDAATRSRLGRPSDPFIRYTVTSADMEQVDPTPASFLEKSRKTFLGYNDGLEMVSEKFHSRPEFIRFLNPGLGPIQEGTNLLVPNPEPAEPLSPARSIKILMGETTMIVYGERDRPVAVFPCSIARDKDKRPDGELRVVNVVPNPNYTFNPEILREAARREGITRKLILPPGPNNPVGVAWIGLSLPGYGIHGTPEPTAISRTGSMGCFRLANWNARKLLRMVRPGVPVVVIPSSEG